MNLEEFEKNVLSWSLDRGIYACSNVHAQTLKAVSEIGELADAVIKGDDSAIQDAIGDVLVCLCNVAGMRSMSLERCAEAAWDEIKDRKGRMVPGGAFVKEDTDG